MCAHVNGFINKSMYMQHDNIEQNYGFGDSVDCLSNDKIGGNSSRSRANYSDDMFVAELTCPAEPLTFGSDEFTAESTSPAEPLTFRSDVFAAESRALLVLLAKTQVDGLRAA